MHQPALLHMADLLAQLDEGGVLALTLLLQLHHLALELGALAREARLLLLVAFDLVLGRAVAAARRLEAVVDGLPLGQQRGDLRGSGERQW